MCNFRVFIPGFYGLVSLFFYSSVLWSRLSSDGCGNDCEGGKLIEVDYFFSFLYFYEINVHLYFLFSSTYIFIKFKTS